MRARSRHALVVGAAVGLGGFAAAAAPSAGLLSLSVAGAVAAALVLSSTVLPRAVVAAGAFTTSLGVTAVLPFAPPPPMHNIAGVCLVLEMLAIEAALVGVVRRSSTSVAAVVGAEGALASAVVPLRVAVDSAVPPDALEVLMLCLVGALPAGVAIASGGYLRVLDQQRARAIAQTRREQRLALARDLHDLVGHDLSGIVLEAQAAQMVPKRALAALAHIEQIGVAALTSMDHTVRMLHEPADTLPLPGNLADLPDLVGRFRSDDAVAVMVDATAELLEAVPRETGAVAYRIVVESLTNVRRHAEGVRAVRISVRERPHAHLEVTVADNGVSSAGRTRRRGGLGLVGLAERAAAVGGTLEAGPQHRTGWRVRAVLPMPATDSCRSAGI